MIQVPIVSTYNAKGVNQATKSLSKFDKSVNKLGKSFAGLFVAQKLLSYGKASVKAFAADDKAARVLAKSVDNLGMSYANPAIKGFIASLELQFGVLDDQLRPAYQKLLTSTGDLQKSQKLMTAALDLSAMSSLDVVSVAGDLSKAYAGNTRGLMKYSLGLSKTELAGMSFEKILERITKISGGQATIAANTYAGSLDKLKVSAANAQETIGKSLIDAMVKFSGGKGIDGMQKAVKGLGDEIGFIVTGISDMAAAIKPLIPLLATVGLAMLAISNPFIAATIGIALLAGESAKIKERNLYAPKTSVNYGGKVGAGGYTSGMGYTRTPMQSPGDRAKIDAGNAKLAKAKKDELAILTAKNKLTAAEATAKADQAKLDEQKKKFDLERIGIAAGIAQKEDELAKTKDAAGRALLTVELDRLKLQQAILDENAKAATAAGDALKKAEADKLKGEIAAADALAKLATNSGLAGTALGKLAGLADLRASVATVVASVNASTAAAIAEADVFAAAAEAAAAQGDAGVAANTTVADAIVEEISPILTEVPAAIAEVIAQVIPDAISPILTEVPAAIAEVIAEIPATIAEEITSSLTETPLTIAEIMAKIPAKIAEEISPILTEVPAAIAETIAQVIPDAIVEAISPILTEAPAAIAEVIAEIPAKIAEEISPILTQIPTVIDDSLRPGDFKPTNVTEIPQLSAAIDTQALANFFAQVTAFANGKDDPGSVTITINDNTSGLIQIVADAVTDNNRYGNSMVPTGTIAG